MNPLPGDGRIGIGPTDLDAPPATWLAELRAIIGSEAVTRWCADLLAERVSPTDPNQPALGWLAGSAAGHELSVIARQGGPDYWPRVWGARGLLHVWLPSVGDVASVVLAALGDQHWRVREMTSKVVAKWELADAAERLAALLTDPVARVRAAAARALGAVGEAEHVDALRTAIDDPEVVVRRSAARAIEQLATRLDRPALREPNR